MDQVEYLGYTGSVLGYNLYTYCEGNPIVNADFEGTDAQLILDFDNNDGGLLVLGHIALLIQDKKGQWYLTEYNFDENGNYKVMFSKGMGKYTKKYNSLKNYIGFEGWKFLYIKGDFTKSLDYAKSKVNDDLGGYHLLFNNCLHYVKDVLKRGKASNRLLDLYFRYSFTRIPTVFFHNVENILTMRYCRFYVMAIKRGIYA